LPDRYLDALSREAARRRDAYPRPVHSIYIGGGTPTTLSGVQLRRLWREVIAPFPRVAEVEITIEANPGTLSVEVLAALAEMPLTRVSLGVQSLRADELAMLGRIHSPEDVPTAVAALRAIGIPHVNLDLMYALPGQTAAAWAETLQQAVRMDPDHLSLYALMLEEGTPLAAQVAAGLLPAPGEEEEAAMDLATAAQLAAAGFARYEVSNAARPGAVSRHNLGYWLGRDYLGLGTAAVSTMGGLRWRNSTETMRYIARLRQGQPAIDYIERLSARERLLERVMLGLRLVGGCHLAAAEQACGCTLQAIAGAVCQALRDEGWLEISGEVIRLTPAGFPLANMVMTRLMAAGEE
jgi:oxygen-independent coproporphyrinogen-3 oxidase